MTTHRIHSVVVLAPDVENAAPAYRRWGVLSDRDLVAAAPWGEEVADAGSVAATPQVVIDADRSLAEAALLMSEYATAHLLVVEEGADEPVGILSALDVARALAPPPRPAPAAAGRPVKPGDRLMITAHHQGERPRDAEVLEVRGADGGPPYLVRWEDTGRVSLHYPGSDSAVRRLGSR
jgi:CBS domain-containing protein